MEEEGEEEKNGKNVGSVFVFLLLFVLLNLYSVIQIYKSVSLRDNRVKDLCSARGLGLTLGPNDLEGIMLLP